MKTCETCGVEVSAKGQYGSIICGACVRAMQRGDAETIKQRKEKYGGCDD